MARSSQDRIVMAVTSDLSTDQRVHRVALALQEAGFKVHVIGRLLPHSLPLPSAPYQRSRKKFWWQRGKFFYLEFNFWLFWKLLFFPADIIIANDLDTLTGAFFASRISGKKLVYDAHELFTEVPELVRRPRTQRIWQRLERFVLPRVKFFYTVNESLSQIYAKQAKVTPVVIRNLPLRQHGVQARSLPGNILLYQGALNEGRGIERMIAAMEHLPSCILWIVGGGPLQDELRKQAAESVSRDRIVFHGWVRMDQLADLTRQASLCLSMEEDRGLNYRYALPNKVLDAIQCGVPVLVSELPEMAAIVRQHGVGECLGQEDNLAEAVNRILSDAQLWSKYQQACLKAGEELCWEREREKLVQLLREVQLS